jgi:methionyl-tRNA formyltransferase
MSTSLRLVLFGDGPWAAHSLTRLAADGHVIAAVVERVRPSDHSLGQAARALGVPVLRPPKAAALGFVREIEALAPDLGISISYDQILRPALLATALNGFVNFHAGMLPRYRGRNVINWAIINGEEEIGITAHVMDAGIDTGDIILQRALPIGWTDTYGDVLARVVAAFPNIVSEAIALVASGCAVPVAQAPERATYFGGRGPGDEWLDWSNTSRELHNKIRAITHPGPGARTLLGDREVVIWRAYYEPSWPSYIATPGQVVGRCADGSAVVKTGDSTILIQDVQVAGGASGAPCWPIGTRLGVNLADSLRSMMARLEALEGDRGYARGVHDPG